MTTLEQPAGQMSADAPTMHGGLANLDEEHSYWLDGVSGELPHAVV